MRGQPMNEDRIHPVLADLPVFAPSAELWPRIVAARARQQRVHHHPYRWMSAVAAAAIMVAALLVVPHLRDGSGALDGQRESQALESEWHSLAPTAMPAADMARLHVIDAALQAAYDRGARPDELKPLWKQRNEALRGLILTARADTITRI
jgi:hypothetical protein